MGLELVAGKVHNFYPPPRTRSSRCAVASQPSCMAAAGQKRFFGVPLTAGSWCELDTSTLGPGVALTVSQATLAEPLPAGTHALSRARAHSECERARVPTALPAHLLHAPMAASAEVLIIRNGVILCALSRAVPNARLPFNPARDPSFECVGPDGCSVHVVGYTFVHGKRRRLDTASAEEETDGTVRGKRRRQIIEDEEVDGPTEAEYMELQRARTQRVAELAREAAAGSGPWSPAAKSPLPRTRRLSFNPEVVAATYVPKRCGISPVRSLLSLEQMVARREEVKKQQREEMSDDGDEDDDGEALQQVLARSAVQGCARLPVAAVSSKQLRLAVYTRRCSFLTTSLPCPYCILPAWPINIRDHPGRCSPCCSRLRSPSCEGSVPPMA